MRLKRRRSQAQMPEVNLIPMLDVLMTVLTFFIIVSMTLTGQQLFNVNLPTGTEDDKQAEAQRTKLTIGLDNAGRTLIDNKPTNPQEVIQRVQKFIAENPQGIVTLKADRGLKYQNVSSLLKSLRDIGGDRVFLAIEKG